MLPGRLLARVVLVAAFPLHLILAACVRLGDGGPSLYACERVGFRGTTFPMLKYRTMVPNCSVVLGPDYKTLVGKNDPRVTRLGRILRMGIDELPQIANIARGEMAWIGPRPDEPWMLPKYGSVISERWNALPGITGLAQVLNSRFLSTAQGYAIDIWYLRHRSLLLDAWVIVMTPLYLLGWRSVGKRRLRELLRLDEVARLEAACERELEALPSAAHCSS